MGLLSRNATIWESSHTIAALAFPEAISQNGQALTWVLVVYMIISHSADAFGDVRSCAYSPVGDCEVVSLLTFQEEYHLGHIRPDCFPVKRSEFSHALETGRGDKRFEMWIGIDAHFEVLGFLR